MRLRKCFLNILEIRVRNKHTPAVQAAVKAQI